MDAGAACLRADVQRFAGDAAAVTAQLHSLQTQLHSILDGLPLASDGPAPKTASAGVTAQLSQAIVVCSCVRSPSDSEASPVDSSDRLTEALGLYRRASAAAAATREGAAASQGDPLAQRRGVCLLVSGAGGEAEAMAAWLQRQGVASHSIWLETQACCVLGSAWYATKRCAAESVGAITVVVTAAVRRCAREAFAHIFEAYGGPSWITTSPSSCLPHRPSPPGPHAAEPQSRTPRVRGHRPQVIQRA